MESLFLAVRTSSDKAAERTRGTAWLLWPDVVVTALHVVGTPSGAGSWAHEKWLRKKVEDAADAYALRLPGGAIVGVTPLVYDPIADVALLRLPADAAVAEEAFGVLATDAVAAGDPWHAVGYPAFEADPRAVALGGAVSFVGDGLANNAIQLRVDQGTGVAWGGISGCAARNAWDEVSCVVLQTVAGIATCNAAPAEAVARLLRLRAEVPALVAALAERLRELGDDAVEDVANGLWPALSATEGFDADPRRALAQRIAEAGEGGLALALGAIRKKAAEAGIAAPAVEADPIAGRFAIAVLERPNEADLTAVVRALVDEGGQVDAAGALSARLPGMPLDVLEAAVSVLLDADRRLAGGTRGLSGSLWLLAEGARRVVRRDYLRAVLREIRTGDPVPFEELAKRAPLGPCALRRTIVCAVVLGAIATNDGAHRITDTGRAWLAMRPGDQEPSAPVKGKSK